MFKLTPSGVERGLFKEVGVQNGQSKTQTADCRLWTAICELQTANCGPAVKYTLRVTCRLVQTRYSG